MDETEYEDGEAEGALGAASPFETREQYLAAYGQAVEGQRRAAQEEARTRRQAFEQAQRYIESNSYGMPTQSEQLMRLSQALLSPRRSRGFGATLANVVPALAENQQLARRADEQRAEALMRLQQEYATGNAAAGTAAAQGQVEALGRLAPNFRSAAPRSTYDATRGMYVTEGQPVRERGQDRTSSSGQVAEAYLYGGNLIYRVMVNGAPVFVDPAGNQVSVSGGQ
jgi:hypothetical protein